jgi:hypothetical protein
LHAQNEQSQDNVTDMRVENDMNEWIRRVIMVAVPSLLAVPASEVRADDMCTTPPFSSDKTGNVVTITVDWAKLVHLHDKRERQGARRAR